MSYVLQTTELSKNYKQITVVNKISLHLKRGEIYGFIGQNGAGKTTTIRMILNLVKSTEGHVALFGETINDKNIYKHLRNIGAIIEISGFYLNLTAKENLDIHRIMMNITDKTSIDRVMKTVGLAGEEKKKVSQYSLGMKQRLALARALLHDPELLILDEPTNGLDPQGMAWIRDLLIKLANQGKTIFVSSHILSEIEKMVTRIGILHKGHLLEEISHGEFQNKCAQSLIFRVSDPGKAASIFKESFGINNLSVIDGCLYIKAESDNNYNVSKLTRRLFEHNIEVEESKIIRSSLEDYFMLLTGGNAYVANDKT